jgi:hypothetical protein
MNSKETLKKLHKRFPLMTLDELFDILDCYVKESPTPNWWDKVYYNTYTNSTTVKPSTPENCLISKINYSDDTIANINTTGDIQLTASH